MPRFTTLEKTIHGKPVTQHAFLNAVCEVLDRNGEEGGRLNDLVPALGPEWDNAHMRQIISTTLTNMAARGTISKVEGSRGAYKTNNYGKRNGVTNFDGTEKSILAAIRAEGGFCRFRDIMKAHGIELSGAEVNTNRYDSLTFRIVDVISKSELIRQDFIERGVYNLPWDELAAMPIRGRWLSTIARVTCREQLSDADWEKLTEVERTTAFYDYREFLFSQVGTAFKFLRDGRALSIADLLAASPDIKKAVLDIGRNNPQELAVVRAAWSDRTQVVSKSMRDAGSTVKQVDAYKEERVGEWDLRFGEWLYQRFERGSPGAHVGAPQSLYESVGEFFGVCPAALSRAMPLAKPFAERIRPERTRRHIQDIEDARAANEAAIARNQITFADDQFETTWQRAESAADEDDDQGMGSTIPK